MKRTLLCMAALCLFGCGGSETPPPPIEDGDGGVLVYVDPVTGEQIETRMPARLD